MKTENLLKEALRNAHWAEQSLASVDPKDRAMIWATAGLTKALCALTSELIRVNRIHLQYNETERDNQ